MNEEQKQELVELKIREEKKVTARAKEIRMFGFASTRTTSQLVRIRNQIKNLENGG